MDIFDDKVRENLIALFKKAQENEAVHEVAETAMLRVLEAEATAAAAAIFASEAEGILEELT